MKKFISLGITTAIILTLFSGTTLMAQKGYCPPPNRKGMNRGYGPPRGPKGPRRCGPMFFGNRDFFKGKLKLSENQIKKIEQLNADYRARFLTEQDELDALKNQLRKILRNENLNLKKASKTIRAISAVEANIRILRIEQRYKLESILTPEQKKRMRDLRKPRRRGR